MLLLGLLISCCIAASLSDSTDTARLIVSKEILNEYIFENKELTVLYTLHNFNSNRAARNVELIDNFPNENFIVVHGSPSVRWPYISASTNVTHSVVVIPRTYGTYNFTSAVVTYSSGSSEKSTHHYTSAPGQVIIYPVKEFNRRFASYTMEWLGFSLLVTPCLLIPFLLWRSSASKYSPR